MLNTVLSPELTAQLLALGIPASRHNYEDLLSLMPPFSDSRISSLKNLAKVVIYLGQRRVLNIESNAWKSLPWGTHACLFYKKDIELDDPVKNYLREGVLAHEKCVWVVSKTYGMESALKIACELAAELLIDPDEFELIRHEDWYETPDGRFRDQNEILAGWAGKTEQAVKDGYQGLRVTGDAHFHPEDLKSFFDYEDTVNGTIGALKIKALCTYCLPKFHTSQIDMILNTHQSAFGEFALSPS